MAVVMAVFSIYLMWKSAELPIGWITGEGPGGGSWSFWLAAGMLICCIAVIIRWVRRVTPESRSEEVFMVEGKNFCENSGREEFKVKSHWFWKDNIDGVFRKL